MIIIFFFHYKTCSSIVTSDYVNQKSTLSKTQQTEKNSFVLISGYSSHSFCWQCIYFINTLKLTLFSSVWGHDPPCMKPLLGGRHIYEDCSIAGIRKVTVDLSRWPVSQFSERFNSSVAERCFNGCHNHTCWLGKEFWRKVFIFVAVLPLEFLEMKVTNCPSASPTGLCYFHSVRAEFLSVYSLQIREKEEYRRLSWWSEIDSAKKWYSQQSW